MSATLAGPLARRRHRLRRGFGETGLIAIGLVVMIWSLLPIYNMLLIALDPDEGEIEFSGNIWPNGISLEGFRDALTQKARYLEEFWHQFGNSLQIGLLTMGLTVLIASLASFGVGRLRLKHAALLTNVTLLTYAIPASLLIYPLFSVMHGYGLADGIGAVVAAEVAFATPFAILVLRHYATLVPLELDEAARIDGASALQVYRRIYLPLMAPALTLVAIYALLLSWNDYVYQFVLLSSTRDMTVSVMQAQLFVDLDAPWNAMMAAAIVYALPPMVLFLLLRRWLVRRLSVAGAGA